MNTRIEALREALLDKRHHAFRESRDLPLAEEFAREGLPAAERAARRLAALLERERPVILPGQRILFLRTARELPPLYTGREWAEIAGTHFIHEKGCVCNITPDYATTIARGLDERKREIRESLRRCDRRGDAEGRAYLETMRLEIDALLNLSDRYAAEAERTGNREAAEILRRIPRQGAQTFHEALQFFRILHFTLWLEGEYHNTVGRFDQYMAPYLRADLEAGRLDEEGALELVEEFFLSFNWDSDLYPGVQQGDNGQSLVLGGVDGEGRDAFNRLSALCLTASRELKLIDPKINLRVHKDTPLSVYEAGTRLTKEGLGFPQYSSDDAVIPGLTAKGYRPEDARNYVVAACWEFIIPGLGMDIPNIAALSFPKAVDTCLRRDLAACGSLKEFTDAVKAEIGAECARIAGSLRNLWMIPAPFLSLLMDGCVERARDISLGGRYNNYGIHGTGLATAADSLAAVGRHVFSERTVTAEALIRAVDADFDGEPDLLARLRYDSPKMGNDDDGVDGIAAELLDAFADALEGMTNERGGCLRAGTGSAMFYLRHAAQIGASPDGRRRGEAFPANYSPSLFARLQGPLSVIRSFAKPRLIRAMNGGPLTLEFHSTLFRDPESVGKVARFVKTFMELGGHQLQLNAVNREALLDAQRHPDKYSNLIVRVWGWSAYFVELDREYQDHVIGRQEYGF